MEVTTLLVEAVVAEAARRMPGALQTMVVSLKLLPLI